MNDSHAAGKESACKEATHASILAWGIPTDRGAWRATIHGVAKSRTRLSDSAQPSTWPIHLTAQQKATQDSGKQLHPEKTRVT